ncbi:MAG: YraN family protein [Anaerolineae bacterium]|jgi:putative endonuclease|nr:YraN family protein [Anaerolineae bacterium]
MSRTRVKLGRQGENLAAEELVRNGYEIIARNWHCQAGEVDIVARRDDVYHFFEVRTRRGREYGTPEESVTPTKRQRMIDVALTYLGEHDLNAVDWRIGFVAVEMGRTGQLARLEVYDSIE